MKKKRERRIAMLLAMMMLIMNLIVSPVWAGPGDVEINATNFPDKNFRTYVATLDRDHDGKLSAWEIADVKSIDVRYESIADLTGIGYFTELLKLDCAYTKLSTLDTGKNTALQELNCYKSQLKSLDISKNTALQKLECSENQLTSLNISKNTALKQLYCSANKLTSLDVSKNTALENLICMANQLTSLDVSKNTTLKELDFMENQLTSLDISKNPALQGLHCEANKLTNLDVSSNKALEYLYCDGNQLTNLDVSNNPALRNLHCRTNQLTKLDVSNSPALQTLDCNNNKLTKLDVSKSTTLQKLYCYSNQLTGLDLSKNTALQKLYCYSNQLTDLDLSKNTALQILYCNDNKLTKLDVSNNSALQELYCFDNQLTKLDVSNNPALIFFYCEKNQIKSLDISNNKALEYLFCSENQLTSLNLVNNTEIFNFEGDNQTYDVKVKTSDMKIVYTDFPGIFDITKATNIVGADSNFKVDVSKPSTVTYDYNTVLSGRDINVTLNITYVNIVTFNTNGGTAVASQTITAGEHVTKPADPTKDSYTFAGWYKDAEFTTPFDYANEKINADITIYAKWTQNAPTSYTVKFNTNGGSTVNPQTIAAGEHVTKPADPTKDGFTFDGWYKDAGLTKPFDFVNETINADTTLYAKWTQNAPTTYTVTFNANGHGTAPASITVNKGAVATKPADPTDADYDFGGWYTEAECTNEFDFSQAVNDNIILYAKWTEKTPPAPTQYTLTASVDGGHGSVTPTNATKNKNETVTLTFTPETGYEIDEVKVNDVATTVSGNTLTLTMDGDKTVVVKYKATPTPPIVTPVTITFDKNGGTGTMAEITKNKGESFTLPACTFTPPAGKEFKAWQVDGTEKKVGDNIVLNGDKIIKAVWKDIGSLPPTPPIPPTPPVPPTPPTPNPWIVYPGWYYNFEAPKPKEEKPVSKMEMDWKLELIVGVSTINREINGVQSKIKMDVAPYIRDGRTMLPIRYVAEALGFDVEWISSTRTVVLKNNSTRVEIPVDTNKIIVNGEVYLSDVKPEIKNNRTMLPIANIARALGLKDGKDIIWDSKSKMVTIYRTIVVK